MVAQKLQKFGTPNHFVFRIGKCCHIEISSNILTSCHNWGRPFFLKSFKSDHSKICFRTGPRNFQTVVKIAAAILNISCVMWSGVGAPRIFAGLVMTLIVNLRTPVSKLQQKRCFFLFVPVYIDLYMSELDSWNTNKKIFWDHVFMRIRITDWVYSLEIVMCVTTSSNYAFLH
jgi:hypothetical protein